MARGYHVQLGAYRTEPRAEKGWTQLRAQAPDLLGGIGHMVVADARPNGQPTLYQLRTTAFADRGRAADLCQQLKARTIDCFVLAARGAPAREAEIPMADSGPTWGTGADPTSEGRAWPAAAPVVAGGRDVQFQVQLAAYRTLERAERGWQILNRTAPGVLGRLTHVVVTPTQLPEASPLFRLRTREFAERPPADTVCGDLKSRNLDCLVVATTLRTGSDQVARASTRAPRRAVTGKPRPKKAEVAAVTDAVTAPRETPEPSPRPAAAAPPGPAEPTSDGAPDPAAEGGGAGRTGYSVQLAAYKTARLAEDGWKRYRDAAPDLLGQLQPVIAQPDGTPQNRMFRLRAATFEERAVADALCFELKARRLDCLVVQTRISGSDLAASDGGSPAPAAGQPGAAGPEAPIEIQVPPRP
jgi:cell division septation protein DedD